MRVLPYFQSMVSGRQRVAGRSRTKSGRPAAEAAQAASGNERPSPAPGTRPLRKQEEDHFIAVPLAKAVVHSIQSEEPKPALLGRNGPSYPGASTGIVKSGHYSLYRLDGRVEEGKNILPGTHLDISG